MLGYIGCSQTFGVAQGLDSVGTIPHWTGDDVSTYPGGALAAWADFTNNRWSTFESLVATKPPAVVWFEVCVGSNSRGVTFAQEVSWARQVLRHARGIVRADYYISGFNRYAPPEICRQSKGAERSWLIAQAVADSGLVPLGPEVGPLTLEMVDEIPPDQSCHANQVGKEFQAGQIEAWYAGL